MNNQTNPFDKRPRLPALKMRLAQSAFRYGLCAGCVFAMAIWSSADSILVPKLESLPHADDIVAFANWTYRGTYYAYIPPEPINKASNKPSTPPVARYHLKEDCLTQFLRFGRLEEPSTDWLRYGTQLKDIPRPRGIVFTVKEEVFYWEMRNEHFLDVWNKDGHTATVSLADGCPPALEYPTNKLLIVPKKTDVVGIISTNNINRDRSAFQDSFKQKLREQAKQDNQDFGLPDPPPPKVEVDMLFKFLDLGKAQASRYRPLPFGTLARPNGGLVLRDRRILYYELWEPKLLFIEAEDGSSCVIRLK